MVRQNNLSYVNFKYKHLKESAMRSLNLTVSLEILIALDVAIDLRDTLSITVDWDRQLVPRKGLEPSRGYPHKHLKLACLPVSPPRPNFHKYYHNF